MITTKSKLKQLLLSMDLLAFLENIFLIIQTIYILDREPLHYRSDEAIKSHITNQKSNKTDNLNMLYHISNENDYNTINIKHKKTNQNKTHFKSGMSHPSGRPT